MLSRMSVVGRQLRTLWVGSVPLLGTFRGFAKGTGPEEIKKIPIDPAEYRLKRQKPACGPAEKKQKGKEAKGKKPIGPYRADKKVEYEWIDPGPNDTGLNPDYDKVNVPNKANYVYKEYGFKVKGPEPTRYFDWERHGRVTDFQSTADQ